MFFFIVCEWLYNMNLCMRVIMYIINLFLCCVCFVIIWYVCVTTVFFSFLNVYNKHIYIDEYINDSKLMPQSRSTVCTVPF